MSSKVNLIYKLSGQGIEDGIDVFELSPILLSFGKMITEAHRVVYPDHREIAINIKPFQKGSFEIDILMFAKSNLQQLMGLIKSPDARDIKELLEWIGLIGGATGIVGGSLIGLIKFLKGRAKSVEKLKSGEYRYTAENNISITVHQNIHKLYQNTTIQQSMQQSISKPLELSGVDKLESYVKNEQEKTKITLDKGIVEPIKKYSEIPISEEEIDTIENARTLIVHPKRISLEGEKHSWSFRVGGSKEIITANIMDEGFLDKVRDGQIRLAQSDKLIVEVIEKQIIKGDTTVTMTFDIVKVKEYDKAPEPGVLFKNVDIEIKNGPES